MSDLTCPYCGATIDHDQADLWEYENEDEIECPECEKSFVLLVEVTYEYTGRRKECQDDEHEYGEWERTDVDQSTLDRWAKDPTMSRHKRPTAPYSWYIRECKHCDDSEHSKDYQYGQEVPQDEIESRWGN